jgi:hypothetical protein
MTTAHLRLFIGAVAAGAIWVGATMIRRPTDVARGLRTWSSRRWMSEDDVPSWARDEERYAFGARVMGRWLVALGILLLTVIALAP